MTLLMDADSAPQGKTEVPWIGACHGIWNFQDPSLSALFCSRTFADVVIDLMPNCCEENYVVVLVPFLGEIRASENATLVGRSISRNVTKKVTTFHDGCKGKCTCLPKLGLAANKSILQSRILYMFLHTIWLVNGGSHEKRLLSDLLDSYNVLERPVGNESDPLVLSFGLTLMQIIDVYNFARRFIILSTSVCPVNKSGRKIIQETVHGEQLKREETNVDDVSCILNSAYVSAVIAISAPRCNNQKTYFRSKSINRPEPEIQCNIIHENIKTSFAVKQYIGWKSFREAGSTLLGVWNVWQQKGYDLITKVTIITNYGYNCGIKVTLAEDAHGDRSKFANSHQIVIFMFTWGEETLEIARNSCDSECQAWDLHKFDKQTQHQQDRCNYLQNDKNCTVKLVQWNNKNCTARSVKIPRGSTKYKVSPSHNLIEPTLLILRHTSAIGEMIPQVQTKKLCSIRREEPIAHHESLVEIGEF
ncbi:hypothetical protein WN51_02444 [Melipona quadrifasciata]|uniref:Uncharacterized protein n=1 Tax=Melipona quadrifasciata TaxID=166423 RepID=A0A0M8ZXG5_9HYME|nr:hypothetical protein WN51_02444 [Melipona quadrifasciata]